MKKLVLTFGAAVLAFWGLAQVTGPGEASVHAHRGWVAPYVRVRPAVPYRLRGAARLRRVGCDLRLAEAEGLHRLGLVL
jgi:hypothetical protein